MMMRLIALFALASSAIAFTMAPQAATASPRSALPMFSKDDAEKYSAPAAAQPLASMDEAVEESTTSNENTILVKEMNSGEVVEVAWVDPYMSANTDPSAISPLSVLLISAPVLLIVNDFLHFIPPNSPLSFVTHY